MVASRAEARAAIESGRVTVGGMVASKAATMVTADAALDVASGGREYASRAGAKLAAALDRFNIDPSGRRCLDAGASTGGFTDVLLQRGAAHVVAVDVGYGQLSWVLRGDDRVTVLERTNVRTLTGPMLPYPPDLVVADLSFISLRTVLPALVAVAAPTATFVVLVKPQFEAGRADVGKGGVVRDSGVWARTLREVIDAAQALGLGARGVMTSPVRGPAGNVEFPLWLETEAATTVDIDAAVTEAGVLRA
jgi:23S rRNA (cytidine1920-2'-O)/16S rRNA (cytidine1409-2'-O)-methyltransferase